MKNLELSYHINPLPWTGKETVFDEAGFREDLKALRAAGVSWAAFNGAGHHNGDFHFDLPKAIERISSLMKENGMKLSSFHYGGFTLTEPGSSQELVRENMRKDVAAFARFKPKAFVIHSWWPVKTLPGDSQGFKTFSSMARRHGEDAVVGAIASNLKFLAKLLAERGVLLAVETMGKFMPPCDHDDKLPRLLEMIDEPNVGYCLDSGHVFACGHDVPALIRKLGSRIYETHLHDNRGLGARVRAASVPLSADEHLSPGFGCIPWIDAINAFHEIAFKGPFTFETLGWPHVESKEESFKQAVAWWRVCEKLAEARRPPLGSYAPAP